MVSDRCEYRPVWNATNIAWFDRSSLWVPGVF